jgi:hypothetical protein
VKSPLTSAFGALLRAALSYPEAWEDHPWGETVVKVRKRIFVFLWRGDGALRVTCKLAQTSEAALSILFYRAIAPKKLVQRLAQPR